MTKTKTAKKPAARKSTSKSAAKKPAKASPRTGEAPRSGLDLDETKKLEAARAKKAGAKSAAANKAKVKKTSALDAAATLLKTAKEPMTTRELIEAMAAKGLWKSPGGKTPDRTLYSALTREIGTKGKESRFKKADGGKFASAK
ncbi:MAG: winged helix-turn-helix domain-containing protein [Pirellulales bacterium]|nr:winged helix-turn-helix domain-containing protein [Pirellulales bacterium]